MIISRTPVRISFAGGGTDLPAFFEKYSGSVLSAAIDKYFYTILTERDDNLIQIISADLKVVQEIGKSDPLKFDGLLRIPLAVIDHLECRKGFNLFLASEIMPGTGLGSSAAVCVNILNTLAHFTGKKFNKYDLAERAFHIAKKMLNEPVGKQDEFAASFGGINEISFHPDQTIVSPLKLEKHIREQLEQNIMLFFTGSSRRSTEILKEQETSSSQQKENVIEALQQSRSLVAEMKKFLLNGRLDDFGRALDVAWGWKKKFSQKVSNPKIDFYYELAKNNGALGGKITGAGGGGFLMLYCERENQERVRTALMNEGLVPMSAHMDMEGSTVIYNDPLLSRNGHGDLWQFVKYH